MLKILQICFGAALALFAASAPAWADLTCPTGDTCFNLNMTGSTATDPQYVQVALSQVATNEVSVTVSLNPALASLFVTTGNGNNHPTFGFNVAGATITSSEISGLPSNFAFETGPFNTSNGFGSFQYAIIDTKGSGMSGGLAGPITFDITVCKTCSLSVSALGGTFVSDIFGTNGKTFLVARLPEAPTPYFLAAGLLGLTLLRWRRSPAAMRRKST